MNNRKHKGIVAFIMAILMLAGSVATVAAQSPSELGKIPLRAYFEEDGFIVDWFDEDRSIHIILNLNEQLEVEDLENVAIILFADYNHAFVGDIRVELLDGISLWQYRSFISERDLDILYDVLFEVILEIIITAILASEDPTTNASIATFTLTEEASVLALSDLNFVEQLILENTPWASVLYRAYLFDIIEHFETLRYLIENMIPIDAHVIPDLIPFAEGDCARALAANYLFALLLDLAWRVDGIGHLGPQDLRFYRMLVDANVRLKHTMENPEENVVLMHMLNAHLHPMVVWFYGEFEVDLEAENETNPEVPGNIATQHIIPGEIAYLRINSFMTCMDFDDLTIVPFFHEIEDYDHLIIDLRGNRGGWGHYFHERIFRRLINEPVEYIEHQFFAGGEYVRDFMDMTLYAMLNIENIVFSANIVTAGIMPADEFIDQHGMEHFSEVDAAYLSWVIYSRTRSLPDEEFGFNGKVWLLIDGFSASASADAALMSINTGFATVVGEPTSGVMGGIASYIVLPNTGILWRMDLGYLTDADGRSFEVYGISPDVFNFDGMDALETVMAIIEEME